MSNWPLVAGDGLVPLRGYGGTSGGALSTPSLGTAHTKSVWVEITPSTPCDGVALHLTLNNDTSSSRNFLFDIAIGASGAEVVIVPNLWWCIAGYRNSVASVRLPIAIPKGSRVSIRSQANGTGTNTQVYVHAGIVPAHPLLMPGLRCLGSYGVNTATTTLTAVAQAYTVLSWAEIVSTTPSRVRAVIAQYGGAANGETFGLAGTFHVGVGAAGAESLLLSAFPWRTFGGDAFGTLHHGPTTVDVAAGDRLSVAVTGNSSASNHQLGLLIFG